MIQNDQHGFRVQLDFKKIKDGEIVVTTTFNEYRKTGTDTDFQKWASKEEFSSYAEAAQDIMLKILDFTDEEVAKRNPRRNRK